MRSGRKYALEIARNKHKSKKMEAIATNGHSSFLKVHKHKEYYVLLNPIDAQRSDSSTNWWYSYVGNYHITTDGAKRERHTFGYGFLIFESEPADFWRNIIYSTLHSIWSLETSKNWQFYYRCVFLTYASFIVANSILIQNVSMTCLIHPFPSAGMFQAHHTEHLSIIIQSISTQYSHSAIPILLYLSFHSIRSFAFIRSL